MRYLPGHTQFVQALAFTPDSRLLISGSADQTIRVWDLTSGESRKHTPHTKWVSGVAIAPDGKEFCSVGHDGRVYTSSLAYNRKPHLREEDQGTLSAVEYSRDGRFLAWAGYTGVVVLWERRRRTAWWDLEEPERRWLFSLAFAPDSRWVLAGGEFPGLARWDLKDGSPGKPLKDGKASGGRAICFAPDGKRVFAALDKSVCVWEWPGGKRLGTVAHPDVVSGVAITPDGRKLVTTCWDGQVRQFDLELNGAMPAGPAKCYSWEIGQLFAVAVSPDGMLAAAGGDTGARLAVWDLAE